MKCIARLKVETDAPFPVVRVEDEKADELVRSGDWRYAKKEEWKATGRSYKLYRGGQR